MEVLVISCYCILFFGIYLCYKLKKSRKVNKRKKINIHNNDEYYYQTHKTYKSLINDSGSYGEYLIYNKLQNIQGYKKFLFNLYIPKKNGERSEIDIVMIHSSGIYVIESKNYKGWIFGRETDQTWTQVLPYGFSSIKYHFFNPIYQNQLHIKVLKNVLKDYQDIPFYSYIVFGDACEFKHVELTTANNFLLHCSSLIDNILLNINNKSNKLTDHQIDNLYERLYQFTQISNKEKMEHIENIRLKKMVFNNKNNRICPLCGGYLILRTATKGKNKGRKFLGCSNFPSCLYKKIFNS